MVVVVGVVVVVVEGVVVVVVVPGAQVVGQPHGWHGALRMML